MMMTKKEHSSIWVYGCKRPWTMSEGKAKRRSFKEKHIFPVTTRQKNAKEFVHCPFPLLVLFVLDCECLSVSHGTY
jgi:hypothetical protein